jgi:RNA recognition motif-containing protein
VCGQLTEFYNLFFFLLFYNFKDGLKFVDLFKCSNGAYCFLKFVDRAAATVAFKRLSDGIDLHFGRRLEVNWSCDDKPLSNKIVVNELTEKTSYEQLNKLFSKFGRLKRIVHLGNHAYIDYESVCEASRALDELNAKFLNGQMIEIRPRYDRPKLKKTEPAKSMILSHSSTHNNFLDFNHPDSGRHTDYRDNMPALFGPLISCPVKPPLGIIDVNISRMTGTNANNGKLKLDCVSCDNNYQSSKYSAAFNGAKKPYFFSRT